MGVPYPFEERIYPTTIRRTGVGLGLAFTKCLFRPEEKYRRNMALSKDPVEVKKQSMEAKWPQR